VSITFLIILKSILIYVLLSAVGPRVCLQIPKVYHGIQATIIAFCGWTSGHQSPIFIKYRQVVSQGY
jgi:hypothetical protein